MFLTGEIIHNPHVNDRLRSQEIRILTDPGEDRRTLGPDDVVILPAFGVSMQELAELDRQGCTLVDTTCGSVLNVWKNVRRYAEEGFTAGHPRQGASTRKRARRRRRPRPIPTATT